MMDKKKYILNTAIKMFDANGYHNTTMASIAYSCNISKATLYKFFPSKEELVLEATLLPFHKMHEEVAAIDREDGLSPHEKMINKLEAMFRVAMQKIDFRTFMKHTQPGDMPQKFLHNMHHKQVELAEKVKGMIVEAYGEDIEPISWDLTLCLMGIIHEIVSTRYVGNRVQCQQAAIFAGDCLDGIVQRRRDKQPLFVEAYINRHCGFVHDIPQSLNDIRSHANSLDQTNRDKALAAASVIEKYLHKGNADRIIIDGMLAMLREYPELRDPVDRLTQSLEWIEP